MLVKITNSCHMNCSHCMEDASPNGEHMTIETFEKTIKFVKQYNPFLIISGGEPTEHPEFKQFIELTKKYNIHTSVLSNGTFIKTHPEYLDLIQFQIINDKSYYPIEIKPIQHENIVVFSTQISAPISPFGRAVKNNIKSSRMSPLCFNLRSITASTKNFQETIIFLRLKQKMCIPSIDIHGNLLAGESIFCSKIGTIDDSNETITANILKFKCNKCGLVNNLNDLQKLIIGEN